MNPTGADGQDPLGEVVHAGEVIGNNERARRVRDVTYGLPHGQ